MNFVDKSLEDASVTTKDILNFLYSGPEEWREAGMSRFDWRNIFNVTDQLMRTLNQYAEVRIMTTCWVLLTLHKHEVSYLICPFVNTN